MEIYVTSPFDQSRLTPLFAVPQCGFMVHCHNASHIDHFRFFSKLADSERDKYSYNGAFPEELAKDINGYS